MTEALLPLANGAATPLERVPRLALDELRRAVIAAPGRGRRVAALFGRPVDGALELVLLLAADDEGVLEVAMSALPDSASGPPSYAAITPACPEVHLFERELAEQHGVRPEGHPWCKPVRSPRGGAGLTEFYSVDGEEVHEVAVGPVHAGVIEPGHFRFQCHGERVFHLEIALGYQHRGVERALAGGPHKRSVHYMETLAGDSTVAHATAYSQLHEALSGTRASARSHALRAIALELERLANHTGGLGALAHDVGFLPTSAYCGRLRGDFLNLTATLCGSRFGRGLVRPGGAGFDVDETRAAGMLTRLDAAARDLEGALALLWGASSVQGRFEETGRIAQETARELGLVGVAARACGLPRDVRRNHPFGIYRFTHVPIATWASGDVFARAYVRALEIQRSIELVRSLLGALPAGDVRASAGTLRPRELAATLVEGWRGEVCHVALTDGDGRFAGYKVVDPSFHNWSGLQMAMRDQPISDFPLCNKSFDLSYCGHDL